LINLNDEIEDNVDFDILNKKLLFVVVDVEFDVESLSTTILLNT
jgi:hypothetical protein